MTPFARRVLYVLRRIPPGRVATYGDVARMAGRPGAARAVGNIFREAPEPGLPYHRVIAAGGRLGGFGRNPELKRRLLIAEGHTLKGGRLQRFSEKRWEKG
jgi:methylated-DNA-[protein]-cysteine S-methyltransferase